MADKQIIIDGVDVNECECIIEDYYYQQANNLENGYKHIKNVCELGESGSEYHNLFCKDNPRCHYKQLKRKEQEYDELKQTLIEIKEIAEEDFNHTCWETYARQLKQILQKISKCEVV